MKPTIPRGLKKAAPVILSILGSIGVVATGVFAAKATPKATNAVLNRQAELWNEGMADDLPEVSLKEKVKLSAPFYIPAVVVGATTIALIAGSNVLSRKQQASILAAYTFLDQSYKQYRDSVTDIYGEEGQTRIKEHIIAKEARNLNEDGVYGAMNGERFDFGATDEEQHLFYDILSHSYFSSTFSNVLLAELHTNRNFCLRGESPVEEYYEFLGIDPPEEMRGMSWWLSDWYQFIDFTHEHHLIDDGINNEPVDCWSIDVIAPSLEPYD